MSEWRTLLCAVDFSEPSRRGLEEAAALARRLGALLAVVHVEAGASGSGTPFAPPPRPGHGEAGAAAKLATWAKGAEAGLGQPVEQVLLVGNPAEEIASAAANGGYDAIVIGTHGRGGLSRAVLGSVAEQIVRVATVPVVVVRAG
jgi:nucleotide-binding universal stress UspA family protein